MHNEEFDSNANHSEKREPSGASHHHHRGQVEHGRTRSGSYQHQRKYQDNEGDLHPHKPREKQKTTAIALSVITCLFMCVIGYEIIRENSSKEENVASNKDKKPSLIAHRSSLSEDVSLLDDADNEEDHYESYQVRLLKDQNKQQAAKIKALRLELLEKMQNMHEVKANLFKQEGDPRDKAKIAELNQKLNEKEGLTQQLGLKIKSAEHEIAELTRKISNLEVTRDALATMLDSQRNGREQEILAFKAQLEELQRASNSDKSDVAKKVQLLEATQQHLTVSLEQKTAALTHLEQELAIHKTQLTNKHQELQNLNNHYNDSQNEIKQDILNLVDNLEWEATSKAILTKSLQENIVRLEEELLTKNSMLAVRNEEMENQANLQKVVEEHSKEEVLDLITTLEWEVFQAQNLHQTLAKTLQENTKAIDNKTKRIRQLESALDAHRNSLTSKHDQMLALADLYAFSENQMHASIQHLAISHGLEAAKTGHLQEELQTAGQKAADLQDKLDAIGRQLGANEERTEELTKELASRETAVAAQQLQLQTLLDSYKDHGQTAQAQIENLTQALEKELYRVQQLQTDLEQSLAFHENEKKRAQDLEKQLSEILKQGSALELHLTSADQALSLREKEIEMLNQSKLDLQDKLNAEIGGLNAEIAREKEKGNELQQKLEETLALYTHDKGNLQDLEDKIGQLTQLLNDKEEELKTLRAKLADTDPQLEKALAENGRLLEEQSRTRELEEKYNALLSSFEAGQGKIRELNEQADALAEQLRDKEETTKNLQEVQSNAKDLEEKYNAIAANFEAEQEKIRQMEAQASTLSEQLRARENELESAQASMKEAGYQLSALANENAELGAVRANAEELEAKFNEIQAQYQEKHGKLQELEGNLAVLLDNLSQREQALSEAESKLEETIPHLSQLHQEKQQLLREKSDYEARYQTSTQELSDHQTKLENLSEVLLQTKQTLESTLAQYEEQKAQTQRLERKLQSIALKSTIMEDELAVNKATLENRQQVIQALKESESSLKSEFARQLANLSEELDREKSQAATIKAELEALLDNYQNERDRSTTLQESLQNSTKTIGDLENELAAQKQMILAREHELEATMRSLAAANENLASAKDNFTSFEQLHSELEQEKRNNQSMQAEIKSLLSQYLAEQQQAIELQHELQELSETQRSSRNAPPSVEYRMQTTPQNDEAIWEDTSYNTPNRTNQSRLQRMNEFKNNARQ